MCLSYKATSNEDLLKPLVAADAVRSKVVVYFLVPCQFCNQLTEREGERERWLNDSFLFNLDSYVNLSFVLPSILSIYPSFGQKSIFIECMQPRKST